MNTKRALASLVRRKALAIAVASCFIGYAQANPTAPTVISGAATFAASGKSLNVTNSPGAIINWQGFSVKADEVTRFIQQNAQSAVLNRVTGQEHSAILGQLLSNGRVYLINPNGITVGAGARIDTAGFVASSLNLSDKDALAGRFNLQDTGASGKVVNNGTITTATGGFVYLIAPSVENNGVITSPKGEIILAAGKSVELVDSQKPELRVLLTAPENTVVNVGKMIAEAGSIGIFAGAIRQSGLISANSAVVGENGKIVLRAKKDITLDAGSKTEASGPQGGSITIQSESGTTLVAGIVEAKATSTPTVYQLKDPTLIAVAADTTTPTQQNPEVVPVTIDLKASNTSTVAGKGGSVSVLGDQVGLVERARVDVSGEAGGGEILVGGDYQGKNPEVQNAQRTYVGKDVQLIADAVLKGDGGKVVVWADNDTNFVGSLYARGGTDGGNGGFAEVSGKNALLYRGRVDLRAPKGQGGTVLFDPTDIDIIASGSPAPLTPDDGGLTTRIFQEGGTPNATSQILDSDIGAILDGGTNVTVKTSSAASAPNGGTITLKTGAAIATTFSPNDVTLRLSADKDIVLESSASISAAGATKKLNVILNSGSGGAGTGAIVLNSGSSIISNGGGITLGGGSVDPALNPATGTAANPVGVLISGASLNSGGGNISIRGQGFVDAGVGSTGDMYGGVHIFNSNATPASVSSGAGAITIVGTAGNSDTGNTNHGVSLDGYRNSTASTATVTSTSGNVSITGTGGNNSGSHGLAIVNGGRVQSSSGDITLDGSSIAGSSNSIGVAVAGYGPANASFIETGSTGAITIAGASNGLGAGTQGMGAAVLYDGSYVQTAAGNLTITATSNSAGAATGADGIAVTGARITTASGAISVTGTGSGAAGTNHGVRLDSEAASGLGGTVEATGAGSVSITGTAGFGGSGIGTGSTGGAFANRIGKSTMTGAITLTTDTIDVANNVSIIGAGALTLQPITASTSIGLAGGAGTFALSATELGKIADGFSSITIGRSNGSGAVDVSAVTFTDPVTIRTPSGGSIAINGNMSMGGNALALNTGGAITNGGGTIQTGGGNLELIAGTGIGTQPTPIAATGLTNVAAVTTNGGIFISNSDITDINITTVGTTAGLTATGTVGGGDSGSSVLIQQTSGGSITVNSPVAGTGHVGLVTLDRIPAAAGDNIIINADVISGGGNLTFYAGDNIVLNPGALGTISAGAGAGSSDIAIAMIAGNSHNDDIGAITHSSGTITAVGGTGFLRANASQGISLGFTAGDGTLNLGKAQVNNDLSLIGPSGGTTTAGSVTLANTGALTIQNPDFNTPPGASNAGGTLSISTSGTLTTAYNISAPNQAITLVADDMAISGTYAVNSGTATTTLRQFTNGRQIDLGLDTALKLSLTSSELNQITAGALKIGDANSGNLSITAAIAPTGTSTLSLQSGGTITQISGSTIAETNLALRSAGAITLTEANNVTNLVANISGSGNSLQFNDSNALNVGTSIDGLSGVTTNGGAVTLTTVAGDITSTATTGNITTTSATNSGAPSGAVSLTAAGNLNLAGDIITTGAANNAGAGSIGGQVDLTANEGALTVANITSSGGASTSANNAGGSAAGINLAATTATATAHDVTLNGALSAVGSAGTGTSSGGAGGALLVSSTGKTFLTGGAIDTSGGAAGGAPGVQGAGGDVTFNNNVVLTGAQTITTGATAGNITFNGTLDGTSAGAETLGLTAGAGNIVFTGAVGGGTRVGAITITSAKDVTETNGITAASMVQSAGTGTTLLSGALDTNVVAGVSIANIGGITINANVFNSAGGNIALTTTGTTGDITIAANKSVTSTGGNGAMSFNAGRTIALGAGATVSTGNGGAGIGTVTFNASQTAAGNITLAGDSLVQSDTGAIALNSNGGGTNSITMADVATTNAARVLSTGGAVTLSASKDVALGVIISGSTVGVTATGGSISDNTASETIANIAGTNLTLSAGGAIGGTGANADIDTNVTAVRATALSNVVLRQLSGGGNLDIGISGAGISSMGAGDVLVRVDAGSLNINQNVSTTGAGNIALKAIGGTSDVNLNGVTVSSASGNLQVISGRHVLTSTAAGVTNEFSTGGTLLLDAQDSIGTTSNRIDTTVGTLAAVSAGVSTAGDIFLNQTAGALTVATATGLDGRANLNGIGTSANNNDITLVSAGAVTLTQNVTAQGSGNVALKTTGANDVNVNGATVSSTSGNLQVISGRHILSSTATGTTNEFVTGGAGTLLLDAQDSIGTTTNRIDIAVPTVAAVSAGVSTAGDIFLNQTAGTLTIGTATGLDGRASFSGIATGANDNDIAVVSRAGSITVTGPISANGDALLQALGTGSDIILSTNVTGTSATAGKTVTLQSDRNIVFNSSADISTTNALNVVLNSDYSDGDSAGAIQLNSGTIINSNGGNITLGGGANPLTTAAIGSGALVEGVKLDNAQLVSGAGAINIRGVGLSGSANAHGVSLTNSASATSTSGNVTLVGTGGAGSGGSRGIYLSNGASIGSGSGIITLTGVGSSDVGVEVSNASITSTGSAIIQVTGTGAAGSNDIKVATGTNSIGSAGAAGDILLNGTSSGGTVLGAGGDTTTLQTSGNITLNQSNGGVSQGSGSLLANGLRLIGAGAFNLNQASNNINVLVADLTGGTTTLSYRDANGFSIGAGAGGLSTVKIAGGVADTTNGITVGSATTATNTLTLNAFGAVTQTTSDNVVAGGLQLLGNGPYTLLNAGNNVTTVAANVAGNISYRDVNAFTVGIVTDAPTGVSTTGIATTAGGALTLDNGGVMTIAQNINTDGAFVQISSAGTGTVSITSPRSIRSTGDAVSFASPVSLNGAGITTTIDTTVGSATGGDITFQSTLDAATTAPNAEALTLNAGTGGNIVFTGAVGTASRLGAINIANANNVTESAGITAASLTQAAGQGTTTFNGAVNTDTATGVNLTGNAQTVNAGITTTGNGSVSFSNAGLLTLNADISSDGAVTQNGAGVVAINTDRTITTTADPVGFATNVTLNKTGGTGLLTIDTTSGNASGNNITFSGKLDGSTAGAEPMTLNAGSAGNILFAGAVGGSTRLGAINITNAIDVTESAGITAASLVQTAGQGTTLFSGPVNADTITGVQIATNNIITGSAGTITTTIGSDGVVTFTNTGALAIGAVIDADGNVTQNGSGSTTLNGDIVTTSDLVQFSQPVFLTGNRLIDTTAAPAAGAGGTITFLGAVNGGGNSLTLAAPTATGDITFNQSASNLSGLVVTSGRNFSTATTAPISVGSGGLSVTVGGTTTINSTITTSNSGGVSFTNGGLLTLNADISSDGTVAQSGAGVVAIITDRTITTTADAVGFATNVTLVKTGGTGLLTIDTTSGNAAGNNISFSGQLDGTTSGAEPLTLNAGTAGNIVFAGAVGAASRLGAINIANANNVTQTAGITAASLTQAAGQGTTTFNGAVNTNTATGVNLTGSVQTVNAGITTTGNGSVSFSNAGLLTLNADISSDGAVTQNGAGVVTINTDRAITTTSDAVGFATNVTLNKTGGTGLLTIDTTSGNVAGNNISFSGKLDGTTSGAEPLTLNAGTAGNIVFAGAVGTASRLGAINITNANNVTETAGITAASLTQAAGQGTTTFNGVVNTNTATGVNLTGNVQTVNADITTAGNGTVTFSNAGLLTLNGDIVADGAVTQNGAATVTITVPGSITTTGDAVNFLRAVTLNGGASGLVSIDTRAGGGAGGDITFQSTLDAATAAPSTEALTLNAGTGGNVVFTGAVGAASRLGVINIANANNVTQTAGITAASLTQAAGEGTTTFNGALNTNTATGVNLTGNAQTVNAGITTTGNGSVSFSNAGLLTLNADISSDGAVTQNGAGAVTINTDRTITTTADAVDFAANVTLNKTGGTGLFTINTTSGNAAGNNITFSGKLDGTTAGAEPLMLNAGTAGNILFAGAVGATGAASRLGAINIANANNLTQTAGITAASLMQAAGQGTTTFNGAVNTNTATGVNLTGNVQTVNAGITTTGNGSVSFSNAGLLTLNGDIVADGAVVQNGAGLVTITAPGSITTTSDAVNFLRAVTLNGGASSLVSIDTRAGGGAGGDITFHSTVNAAAPNAEALTLNAGTGGNILFTGAVGAASRLGVINIANANNVMESAGITAASLTQAAGQGTTTFNGALNTNTATGANLTGNAQTVNAGITTTGNGSVSFSNAGLLTLNADISSDGAVTQNGAGMVTINTDRTITTTADAVGFAANVTLVKTGGTGLLTINTTSGNAAGNNITFSSKLDGTTSGAELLALNAGTVGNILFAGAVGATGAASRLGAINITNANNVTETAGIMAASLTQAAGQGTTTFNGAVNTNTATGVNLTGNVQTVNADITTTGNGTVTFSNAGLLTLNGDIVADGAVVQNGAGSVTITAPGSITTTGDAVNFLRAVTLNGGASGLVSIDTRAGGAAGGDITFQSTLDAATAAPSAEALTLNAGTAGNIVFTGAVGAASRLGAINIANANNVTQTAGITAASLTQAAGEGTTTFNGALNTNTATGVNLTGNAQTVNAGITTTGNGNVSFSNAGLLTLNADISSDGAVTQNGAGAVTINTDRTITTTADAVGFATNVTLNKTGGTGLFTINTTSGNAAGNNITFSSKLDGTTASAENLSLNAGSAGSLTFAGAVGTTRLGDVDITQAKDVTVQSAFNAKTLTQSQGATGAPSTTPSAGTTTINAAVDTTGNTSLATSGVLNVSASGSIAAGAGSTVTLSSGNDMTISGNVTAPAGATLSVKGTDNILTQNGGILSTSNSAIAIVADEMVLTAAVNSGSGAVVLKPNNTSDTIQLGAAAAGTNSAAATLELSNGELNTIVTTGGLTIGAADNTGAIIVAGALTPTTAQNGFTLLNNTGGIAINAPVTYAAGNGNLTLSANGGGATTGAIITNGAALDAGGILAMNAATGVGTLASPMVLSHAGGTNLSVTNTTSGGVFERVDSGDLNVISINNSAAASGGVNLNVGTNLNINGTVQNTNGAILLVAGNDAAYTAPGGFGLSPALVPVGTLGGANINGPVIARNGGAISIFSTDAIKQSLTAAAGLQSIPAAGSVAQGAFKARTFNNTAKVGVIDLQNNLAGSGNSMGPITLEARLAGSLNPPPYAESNIDYRSINGTNVSGIGTAADFSLVAPSHTIDLAAGSSLSGTNISLIATAGDVTVNSAITNGQINGGLTGGSLNLYATGNIVLNNPGGGSAGVVIGKDLGTLDPLGNRQFEKFDHTLKLVATGDVRIFGSVEMVGDLALRANASASEASGSPTSVPGFGAGKGSVIIAGSAANPVEVRAKNIVVGVKDANGKPLPVQNLIIDNSANLSDTGKFLDTVLRADEKLDIYLNGDQGGPGTSGNIEITGGTASAISAGIAGLAGKSSALAVVRGDIVTILGVRGGTESTQNINPSLPYTTNSSNITLNGGTATSDTAAGGGALAAADAMILATRSKFIDIGGNLAMTGGTADSARGGQTSAAAKIDPVSLTINTGGYVNLVGGTGPGAPAAIVNAGDIELNIGGKFDYTYTDATGTHTAQNVGLLMVGGIGSGIFDRNNLPIALISDVSSQVRVLFTPINGGAGGGRYALITDATKATAFIQSASPRGFDDSLMSYIIFAANEETRTGRIRTNISNLDDSSKPSCN